MIIPKYILYTIYSNLSNKDLAALYRATWYSKYVLSYCKSKNLLYKMVCWDLDLFKRWYKDKTLSFDLLKDGCSIEVAKWVHRVADFCENTITYAAGRGDIEFIDWMIKSKREGEYLYRGFDDVLIGFISNGNLDILKQFYYSHEECYRFKKLIPVYDAAAITGNIEIMKWLWKEKFEFTEYTLYDALKSGNLTILDWLWDKGCKRKPEYDYLCDAAVASNDIKVIKWYFAKFKSNYWGMRSMSIAIKSENLELIKWMRTQSNPCPWEKSNLADAAETGNLKILEWIWKNGCPMSEEAYSWAAMKGHLHILKWLLANTPQITESSTFTEAARYGDLNILKWLLNPMVGNKKYKRFKWDTITFAAATGNREIMEWLLNPTVDGVKYKGCPFDDCIIRGAAYKGDLEIIKWTFDLVKEYDATGIIQSACSAGKIDNLNWILNKLGSNNIKWDHYCYLAAARNKNIPVMNWLLEHGCPWDAMVLRDSSYESYKPKIVEWVKEKKLPGYDNPELTYLHFY
jgi:hypothetical protein